MKITNYVSSHSLINHTMKYLSLGVVTRIIQSKSGLSLTPCRAGGRPPSGPGGGGANGSRLCKKGRFYIISAVSSPLDRSLKALYTSLPRRPVHSDTNYYTAEWTEAWWRERKCPNCEPVAKGGSKPVLT